MYAENKKIYDEKHSKVVPYKSWKSFVQMVV